MKLLNKEDNVHDSLISLVKDKFGNYVVQKIIEHSDLKTRDNIIKRIESSQSLKRRDGFSKHVINYIEQLTKGNNNNSNSIDKQNKNKWM